LPEFRDFVLLHDYDDYTEKSNYTFVLRETLLLSYHIVNDITAEHNADTVNQYLKENDAYISEFLLEDYRKNKSDLKKHIYLGISPPKLSLPPPPPSPKLLPPSPPPPLLPPCIPLLPLLPPLPPS
jgi:hypothetical protein